MAKRTGKRTVRNPHGFRYTKGTTKKGKGQGFKGFGKPLFSEKKGGK